MSRMRFTLLALLAVVAFLGLNKAHAGKQLVITIPRHSSLTPVQRLNREGVDAVKRHHYEKAETLFYKAYLYDPGDPFTLNNLGYVSELQGKLELAHRFYALASQQGSNAMIDRSNAKNLLGKPMTAAFEGLQDLPMQVNRMNVSAMELLSEGRGFEAEVLLQQALALDHTNPFTENNLGVADEAIGDYDGALNHYEEAANSRSLEPVVITLDRAWRGKSVSSVAAASARRLQERMQKMVPAEAQGVMFTVRGVLATNRNDWPTARQNFLSAYSVDPVSAFSLNNRGYVAERDGDLESAQFFYSKARKAEDSNVRVGVATQHLAEGRKLSSVAMESGHEVADELERYSQSRRKAIGPIELIPRSDAPTEHPDSPLSPP